MEPSIAETIENDYIRKTLSIIINPFKEGNHIVNRSYSAMDLFPTTLSSIGVTIEGDKLALGIDLFSGIPTLLEIYDVNDVNKKMAASSKLYNSLLFNK